MADSLERVHDSAGGRHGCLFCRRAYWCDMAHTLAGEPVMAGMRCCPDCRLRNMADARKLRMGGD